jgi:hypothetical protein
VIFKLNFANTTPSNRFYDLKRDVEKVEGIRQRVTEMIKGLEKIGARNYLAQVREDY